MRSVSKFAAKLDGIYSGDELADLFEPVGDGSDKQVQLQKDDHVAGVMAATSWHGRCKRNRPVTLRSPDFQLTDMTKIEVTVVCERCATGTSPVDNQAPLLQDASLKNKSGYTGVALRNISTNCYVLAATVSPMRVSAQPPSPEKLTFSADAISKLHEQGVTNVTLDIVDTYFYSEKYPCWIGLKEVRFEGCGASLSAITTEVHETHQKRADGASAMLPKQQECLVQFIQDAQRNYNEPQLPTSRCGMNFSKLQDHARHEMMAQWRNFSEAMWNQVTFTRKSIHDEIELRVNQHFRGRVTHLINPLVAELRTKEQGAKRRQDVLQEADGTWNRIVKRRVE